MDNRQLPFCYEDRQVVEELLKNVSFVLKDSDAAEEKEAVRQFLQKVTDAFSFVTVGSSQTGKSSLLNALFQFTLYDSGNTEPTKGFCEYRNGAEEALMYPDEYTTRMFRTAAQLEGLKVVDMPGIERMEQRELKEKVRDYVSSCNVLLAVYDAQNVRDYAMWDLLEDVKAENIIFVLTKCDLAEPGILEENEAKLKQYMSDAGIQAPVFRISSRLEEQGMREESGIEELRRYISTHVIGENPVLTNQRENLSKLKTMLGQLSESFGKRMQQYEQDAAILRNINVSLDSFVTNNQILVDDLKDALRREIDREVENYQDEIITKLDPHKIKERFPNGSADFVDYLNMMNEGYRKRMTDNVNRMTRESVQAYLAKLEQVFEEATGYLRTQKSLIALEDKFYGSMIESKKGLVQKAAGNAEVTKDYYGTLAGASEELFMKLWEARGDRDRLIENAKTVGGVAGTAIGGAAGYAVASVLGGALTVAAETLGIAEVVGVVTAVGSVLWPVVLGLIGAAVIAKMAKKIASANTLPQMEQKVAEAIAEFKEEVAKTKVEMTDQILDTVDKMFLRELETVDRSFSEFRMSVNIDEKNLPLLEEKLHLVHDYMERIEEMQRRSMIER